MAILIEIPEIKFRYNFPEELSECTEREYVDICRLLYANQMGNITTEQFYTLAVYVLLNLKPSKRTLKDDDQDAKWHNIARLSEFVESFFDVDAEGKTHLKLNFLHNPIPNVRVWFNQYRAPKYAFEGIKFGQWLDGFELMHDFFDHPQTITLQKLFAVFYLKRGELHHESFIEKRAKRFKHIDVGYLFGFLLCFKAFNDYLNTAEVFIAGKTIDLSIIFDNDLVSEFKSSIEGIGVRTTAHKIAKSQLFGDWEGVRTADFMNVVLEMHDMTKTFLDEKAYHEQMQKQNK